MKDLKIDTCLLHHQLAEGIAKLTACLKPASSHCVLDNLSTGSWRSKANWVKAHELLNHLAALGCNLSGIGQVAHHLHQVVG